jgi:hypothetical protein
VLFLGFLKFLCKYYIISKNLDKEIEKFTNEITDINDLNSIFDETDENKEIHEYLKIFLNNGFKEHYQVNNYITQKNMWNNFKIMRSLNDHGEHKNIKGIQPKYYAIICKRLNISGAGGKQLDDVHLY